MFFPLRRSIAVALRLFRYGIVSIILPFLLQGELRHVILLRSLRRCDLRSRFGIPFFSESPTRIQLRSRRLAAVSMRAPLRGGRMSMARVWFATFSMCWSHALTAETASRRLHANFLLVARMTRARDWLAAFPPCDWTHASWPRKHNYSCLCDLQHMTPLSSLLPSSI